MKQTSHADTATDAAMPLRPPQDLRARLIGPATLLLIVASFWSLDLQWGEFLQADAFAKMGEFIGGFFPLRRAVKTLTRLVLNALRSIPELVWAALLVIAAGLGPFPGTLALAAHTVGVLGRLFADSLENLPREPSDALAQNGASGFSVFAYATLPLALPQLMSYVLYRWENNIRAATVLGVVGAGGLGQLLYYHLSLFHMEQAASVVLAMLFLVGLVDLISFKARQRLTR